MHPSVIPARTEINYKWTSALRHAKREHVHYHNQQEIVIKTFESRLDISLSGEPVDTLIEKMGIKLGNRNRKTTYLTLQTALAIMAMAPPAHNPLVRYGFLYSASNTSKKSIARYKAVSFKHKTFVDMLKRLGSIGFLKEHTGFKAEDAPQGLRTLWIITQTAQDWLTKNYSLLTVRDNETSRELVILKNDDKELIDYEDDELTNSIRQTLVNTNAHRQAQKWEYTPLIHSECNFEEDYLVFSSTRRLLSPSDLECRRIFSETFTSGGRFYCHAQGIRKDERMTMTVNGECCVEIDIKSLHPRLLYNMEGLECPEDCYRIDGYDKEHRDTFKLLCQLLINAKSEGVVLNHLAKELHIEAERGKQYIQDFMRQHDAIRHMFFSNYWKCLQYADSQLTEAILTKCLEKDIPVLPVHDSYITSTRYWQELSEIIEDAYYTMFKFHVVHDIQVSSPVGTSSFNGQEVNQ